MKSSKLYIPLYFVLVILYEVVFTINAAPLGVIFKIAPSVLLFLFLFNLTGFHKTLMILALFFCISGDVFLHLGRQKFFMGGLISFALAHLVYLLYFFKLYKGKRGSNKIIFLFLTYGAVLAWLFRDVGDLQIPVWTYLAIIIFMAIGAYKSSLFNNFLIIGVSVFIFSDTILALDKFIIPIPLAPQIVFLFYFTAQLFIVLGVVKSHSKA